jgi:hypothetical protein
MNYILAFLGIELQIVTRQREALATFPKEDQDYAWRQLNDRLEWRVQYLTRVRDELQGRMDEVNVVVARLETHGK